MNMDQNYRGQQGQSSLFLCLVCQNQVNRLFKIADCQHIFCEQCCISYIKTKTDNFSQAKCLQDGCGKVLDKSQIIYQKLNKQLKDKLSKFQNFNFFQINPQFKACTLQGCSGYFNKKQLIKKCNTCGRVHCQKCLNQKHDGQCDNSHQKQIQKLGYKKCPNCSIWVQKTQGCEYIQCKCGTSFCYRCGNLFERDPCRKKQLWQTESQIKATLKQIRIRKPISPQQILLFVPLLVLKILVTIIVTPILCWLPLMVLLFIIPFVFIFSPLLMIMAIQQTQGATRCGFIILFIIFYPLLSFFFGTIFIIAILLYPCMRNVYHHGVYDPMDQGLTKGTLWYLQFMKCLWAL